MVKREKERLRETLREVTWLRKSIGSSLWPKQAVLKRKARETGLIGGQGSAYKGLVGKPSDKLRAMEPPDGWRRGVT